jgi:hypothetical protein
MLGRLAAWRTSVLVVRKHLDAWRRHARACALDHAGEVTEEGGSITQVRALSHAPESSHLDAASPVSSRRAAYDDTGQRFDIYGLLEFVRCLIERQRYKIAMDPSNKKNSDGSIGLRV